MANPYEGEMLQPTGFEVPNLDISIRDASGSTEQPPIDPIVEETPPAVEEETQVASLPLETETQQNDTDMSVRENRKKYFAALREIRRLPNGHPDQDAWSQKYHQIPYSQFVEKENQKKSPIEYLKNRSILYNQEAMMSPAVGVVDWFTDLGNMAFKHLGFQAPKIPKFENEGAQGFRELSSLVVPFFFLKGKAMTGSAAIHKSGVAAPWLQRLGNNAVFARFAKTGLDLGVGAFTDFVAKSNEVNDTLMTTWKRSKWWGHKLIPERWMSDGKSADDKTKLNVLEGVSIGFYFSVAEGAVKLLRAGRSRSKVTKYLSEIDNQKKLDELVLDPLDSKVYTDAAGDPVSPVEEALRRSDEKYQRDIKELTNYYKTKELPNKPTVGVHQIEDQLQAGIITKDKEDILGVARNQAEIANNVGSSQGSLGTTITEAFRKFGSQPEEIAKRSIIKYLTKKLKDAGPYKIISEAGTLSWKQIDDEGKILAAIISEPTLPRKDLIKIIDNFKETVDGFKKINAVAYRALSKSSINYLDDWANINRQKATGYLIGSEASQISGISEGAAKMDGTTAIGRANELILDRLELFEVETALADFNWKQRNALIDALKNNPKDVNKTITKLSNNFDQKLTDIIPKAKKFRQTLQTIQEEAPEWAKAIRLAYELSEGDVQSIKGINKYIENTFGVAPEKLIYDASPEIPSLINKGIQTNIFNSMLSAIGTPAKALFGNFGGFIAEPAHVFYGALRSGDVKQLRRASWMYFGITDTLQKSFPYAGRIFRKASQTSDEIGTLFRADIRLEKAKGLELAEEIARVAATKGEHGPDVILSIHRELEALGADPILRFGPNAMTALDGLTEATQKVAHDRGLVFDFLENKFPNGNWGQKEFNEAYKDFWKKGWTEEGMISQSAVEYSRREIALNLNTPLTKRLNPLIKKFPILRSIFWFPNTQMNTLDMFGKYSPRFGVDGGNIGANFAGEYSQFFGPYGTKRVQDFKLEEIRQILAKHGEDMTGDPIAKFKHLRNKMRGRVATGNIAVMGAWMMFSQDRIRGDGHWDRKVQKVRNGQGYVRRTYQGLDGKWRSYEWLGPMADWIATTVNVLDNFESVSTTTLEKFGKKMAFVLGASLTDRSFLGNLEPMFGVLAGNSQAMARWIGPLTNSMLPLGGFRNELGKTMYGMLREVENGDIADMIRNRNNFLDIVDQDGALPNVVDYITGKPVNKQGGTFWHRLKNNFDPIKTYEAPTPEGQFLIDIEYSGLPHFNVSPKGVPYTTTEKEELATLIGQDGYFNQQLKSVMRQAEQMTFTAKNGKTIKGYRNILLYLRKNGYTAEDVPEFSNITNRLDLALATAKNKVYGRISTANEITNKERLKHQKKSYGVKMDMDNLDRILELNNSK